MTCERNPYRGSDTFPLPSSIPFPASDAGPPLALLGKCPAAAITPLVSLEAVAEVLGIAWLDAKDERGRMGLGSFKALGAAYVIAHEADQKRAGGNWGPEDWRSALAGRAFVTASAGNHGLSVAAGARLFGARAVIYLSQTVPQAFAERLEARGAVVRRAGSDYEASMAAAAQAAEAEGMTLLSDSSWEGYTALPHKLMEGYLVMASEVVRQCDSPPTHIFLQAGVGGLAGAVAAHARAAWGEEPVIAVVEPVAAPALQASIAAGHFTASSGPVSNMGRLDCKEASLVALRGLARDADCFITVTDAQAQEAAELLAGRNMATTPSGAAGLAALMDRNVREQLGMDAASRALIIISEGAEEA